MSKKNDYILEQTADGSHTLFVPSLDEHYHSVNGAVQESNHVFINEGLKKVSQSYIRILEIGFGTGLNAFLALKEAESNPIIQHIDYFGIELYPLEKAITDGLNYEYLSGCKEGCSFHSLHTAEWDKPIDITTHFTLHKIWGNAIECEFPNQIDIVFFDAFAPEKQPDMWQQPIFNKLYAALARKGIIATYCAKGEVRRRMQAAGFQMQRLPGPPGKRHMLFGQKI